MARWRRFEAATETPIVMICTVASSHIFTKFLMKLLQIFFRFSSILRCVFSCKIQSASSVIGAFSQALGDLLISNN